MRAGGLASIALVLCLALGEPAGAGFGRADATPILAPSALPKSLAGSLALASLPLARAATHLRVDSDAGIIRSLSLDSIPEDAVKFSLPVQHPGARKPIVPSDESLFLAKASAKARWARRRAWTHLGVLLDAGAENTTHRMRDLPSYGLDRPLHAGGGARRRSIGAFGTAREKKSKESCAQSRRSPFCSTGTAAWRRRSTCCCARRAKTRAIR